MLEQWVIKDFFRYMEKYGSNLCFPPGASPHKDFFLAAAKDFIEPGNITEFCDKYGTNIRNTKRPCSRATNTVINQKISLKLQITIMCLICF